MTNPEPYVTIRYHKNDLPDLDRYSGDVAIDSETLGLKPIRDRLCVVQLSPGDGTADVVQIEKAQKNKVKVAFNTAIFQREEPQSFESKVVFDGEQIAIAYGPSKKKAEQKAAAEALDIIQQL